jgi:hypothetical protein
MSILRFQGGKGGMRVGRAVQKQGVLHIDMRLL